MTRYLKFTLAAAAIFGMSEIAVVGEAFARGGGSNFMNSPGYQRRLQESRGYVTNQSGSITSQPYLVPRSPYPRPPVRRRR